MARRSQVAVVFGAISASRARGVTVDEIIKATGLGKSTIRRHIDTLSNQDRIKEDVLEPDGTPGRCPIIYYDKNAR